MLFKNSSAAVFGIGAYPVEVEVDITAASAFFTTVGLRTGKALNFQGKLNSHSCKKNRGPGSLGPRYAALGGLPVCRPRSSKPANSTLPAYIGIPGFPAPRPRVKAKTRIIPKAIPTPARM
jgi:hypothetical protein